MTTARYGASGLILGMTQFWCPSLYIQCKERPSCIRAYGTGAQRDPTRASCSVLMLLSCRRLIALNMSLRWSLSSSTRRGLARVLVAVSQSVSQAVSRSVSGSVSGSVSRSVGQSVSQSVTTWFQAFAEIILFLDCSPFWGGKPLTYFQVSLSSKRDCGLGLRAVTWLSFLF